jgi:toxin FitB
MARLAGYLLDTNVISETVRARPNAQVMRWLDSLQPEQLHVSVLSLGEIRKGALMLADAKRRAKLLDWLEADLSQWFEARVLPVDEGVCAHWAQLLADAERPLPAIDSLLAATASHNRLVLATRNTKDFDLIGVELLNPWDSSKA